MLPSCLVTAGLERVEDAKIPQNWTLQFIGNTLQIEQTNNAMNVFLANLIRRIKENKIEALVVKGQGIAQCYEKPLWRSCGDIDLLVNQSDYKKTKDCLKPFSISCEKEIEKEMHLGMTIDGWTVELHGAMPSTLSNNLDKELAKIQSGMFAGKRYRTWVNGKTEVLLPSVDDDVVFVFTHILKHFYRGGIGLRQVCDWCRLLWTYKTDIDVQLLERRLDNLGIMPEWKGFAALAVEYLGMPSDAIFFYDDNKKWKNKAKLIIELIMLTGNFGRNINQSYRKRKSKLVVDFITLKRRFGEIIRLSKIYPTKASRYLVGYSLTH